LSYVPNMFADGDNRMRASGVVATW